MKNDKETVRTGRQLMLIREHGIRYYACSECGQNDCKANYCRNCGVKFVSRTNFPKFEITKQEK